MRQTVELILCWPTPSVSEGDTIVYGILWLSTGENRFPFLNGKSITNSYLVRGGNFCPLPLLSVGFLSALKLFVSCGWYYRLSEFTCYNLSACFLQRSLILRGRSLIETVYSELSDPMSFTLCTLSSCRSPC